MWINDMFDIWEQKEILEANGYVIEKLKVSFDRNSHLYSHGSEKEMDVQLDEYDQEFAYKEGEKPFWMNEQPILKWDNRYTVENTFRRLVKSKIKQVLCLRQIM